MLAFLVVSFVLCAAPEQIVPRSEATSTPVTLSQQVRLGHQIATQNCQSCHAIGASGPSPNATAPPFRYLSRRYRVENLSEAFAEGILVGHSVMPEFEFAPDQVAGLVSYLKSVQARAPAKRRKHTRH